jgi:integrase
MERRERHQTGSIYEAAGRFYVRYRAVELRDGQPTRVQRSEFLCDRDKTYYSPDCRAVKTKRDEFMLRVNKQRPGAEISVVDFWTGVYLPFAEKNLRESTVHGYKQTWNQHLKAHFGEATLRGYTTAAHSRFLTSLVDRYGRRTLNHIRATASAVFSHALNLGYCDVNPIKGAKALGRIREPKGTEHYTIAEAEAIINALIGRTDAQLLFALCFFQGLRPSEAVALQWGDIDGENIHIRRSCVRGFLGDCKTPESQAPLPLIKPVAMLLDAWRPKCPASEKGWIFPRVGHHGGAVTDLRHFCRSVIRPVLDREKIAWKGLYAGRRGAGTVLVELTGNLVAAQELLRHKSLTTTAQFYKKRTQTALASGMRLLEAASTEGKQ